MSGTHVLLVYHIGGVRVSALHTVDGIERMPYILHKLHIQIALNTMLTCLQPSCHSRDRLVQRNWSEQQRLAALAGAEAVD